MTEHTPQGPVDASKTPRYAGIATFAKLPRIEDVPSADIAIVGAPFDSGVSFRPGARFGPSHVREASRLLRPYNPAQDASPFELKQVVDAGDISINPFDLTEAVNAVEAAATELGERVDKIVTIGGDHTIALPLLRAINKKHGPVAVLHFDAHLDTWDTYFGAPTTHGTPFRRASEEGLIDMTASMHGGIRGPLYGKQDLEDDAMLGFQIVTTEIRRRARRARCPRTHSHPCRRQAPLHLDRYRCARSSARSRHRHPRGGRSYQPRATADSARPRRPQHRWRRCRRGCARLRPRADHGGRREPRRIRTRDRDGRSRLSTQFSGSIAVNASSRRARSTGSSRSRPSRSPAEATKRRTVLRCRSRSRAVRSQEP